MDMFTLASILTWLKKILEYCKKGIAYLIANPKWLILIYAVIITIVMIFAIKSCSDKESEVDVYKNNQNALLKDVELYKTESGKNAAKSQELELTAKEFKEAYQDQVAVIKDLNLKVNRVQHITTTQTKTSVGGTTQLYDTTIVKQYVTEHDSVYVVKENAQAFTWSDNWNKINGVIQGSKVDCKYEGTDTLNIIAYKVPKKFLFFRWGTKYIEVHATNANPSTVINYVKEIKLRKK